MKDSWGKTTQDAVVAASGWGLSLVRLSRCTGGHTFGHCSFRADWRWSLSFSTLHWPSLVSFQAIRLRWRVGEPTAGLSRWQKSAVWRQGSGVLSKWLGRVDYAVSPRLSWWRCPCKQLLCSPSVCSSHFSSDLNHKDEIMRQPLTQPLIFALMNVLNAFPNLSIYFLE